MKMFRVNKKEITDAVIAAVLVENAPTLLAAIAPSFATGTTGVLMSGAVGYVGGTLLKKPTVANVSLAVALAKIINGVVAPMVGSISGTGTAALQANARRARLGAYTRTLRPASMYDFAYNN